MLASVKHFNIIQYREAFVHQQTTLVIITELAKRGDLHRKIKKTKQRVSLRLKWEDCATQNPAAY